MLRSRPTIGRKNESFSGNHDFFLFCRVTIMRSINLTTVIKDQLRKKIPTGGQKHLGKTDFE